MKCGNVLTGNLYDSPSTTRQNFDIAIHEAKS